MRIGGGRAGWEGAVAALVLLAAVLTGCGLGGDDYPDGTTTASQTELQTEVRQLLKERVRAVRRGDEAAFLDRLVDDPLLRRDQRDYFANLAQLPLARFGYALGEDAVTSAPGRITAQVDIVMELDGFDDAPVRTPTRMTFVREQDGVLRIVAARDEEYERERHAVPQPWDTVPVQIRQGSGVLGVFDRDSWRHADEIVDEVEQGIAEVSAELPDAWSRHVVVYALSDTSFLARLPDLPGGDPEQLDGVAFPVPIRPRADEYAGTRFLLHPRILERSPVMRSRLIRHELVHVALGRTDDRVPTWLSEGLAEYVSVRPLAPQERLISRDAVAAARNGLTGLPADATFNGQQSSANYGIAWYACEYIASVYGEAALWRLFDDMRADGGVSDADQDTVLVRVLGVDAATLARATGARILSVFG